MLADLIFSHVIMISSANLTASSPLISPDGALLFEITNSLSQSGIRKQLLIVFDRRYTTMKAATPHNIASLLETWEARFFYWERDLHTKIDSEVTMIVTFGILHSRNPFQF